MLTPNARGLTAAAVSALLAVSAAGTQAAAASPRAAADGQGIRAEVRAAEQRQLREIGAQAAWRVSRGKGVTVAVLDTGVDATALDLAGSVTTGPDNTKGANPFGYQPPHLHGTFIASLIAGHGSGPGRAQGVIGIAPAARILSVRVILDDQEPGFALYNESPRFSDAIGNGIRYAVRHGAQVINMSLGGPSPSRQTRAAVAYAISHGVVVVAAAGNRGSAHGSFSPYSYPASYTGVICVAAATSNGTRAYFSERNSSVVISAPGVKIVGAGPKGSYLQASGTSPASAFVAGVAALIRAAHPTLSPALVAQAMITTTRRRPAGSYSTSTGFGEVDAAAAMRAAATLAKSKPATGMAAARRYVPTATGPIQVVHRDAARIMVYGGIAAAGGLGFLAAMMALGGLARRRRRDRRGQSAPPGPAALPGPGAWWDGPPSAAAPWAGGPQGGAWGRVPPGGGPQGRTWEGERPGDAGM